MLFTIERMMENVELAVSTFTKKFVDKVELKKLKLSIDK